LKPQRGSIIDNPIGSARGLHFKLNDKQIFSLPGVPREMKKMMESTILPFIRKNSDNFTLVRTIHTTGIMESALAEKLKMIVTEYSENIPIAFLPQFIGVDIRISCRELTVMDELINRIQEVAGKYIYGFDQDLLEDTVGKLLIKTV